MKRITKNKFMKSKKDKPLINSYSYEEILEKYPSLAEKFFNMNFIDSQTGRKFDAGSGKNIGAIELFDNNTSSIPISLQNLSYPYFTIGGKQTSYGHSERIGMRDLLDKLIKNKRNKESLAYNKNLPNSEDNIRRPSSPLPIETKYDYKEFNPKYRKDIDILDRLQQQENMAIYKKFLEDSNYKIKMLSERPACKGDAEAGGGNCNNFISQILPKDSEYASIKDFNSNQVIKSRGKANELYKPLKNKKDDISFEDLKFFLLDLEKPTQSKKRKRDELSGSVIEQNPTFSAKKFKFNENNISPKDIEAALSQNDSINSDTIRNALSQEDFITNDMLIDALPKYDKPISDKFEESKRMKKGGRIKGLSSTINKPITLSHLIKHYRNGGSVDAVGGVIEENGPYDGNPNPMVYNPNLKGQDLHADLNQSGSFIQNQIDNYGYDYKDKKPVFRIASYQGLGHELEKTKENVSELKDIINPESKLAPEKKAEIAKKYLPLQASQERYDFLNENKLRQLEAALAQAESDKENIIRDKDAYHNDVYNKALKDFDVRIHNLKMQAGIPEDIGVDNIANFIRQGNERSASQIQNYQSNYIPRNEYEASKALAEQYQRNLIAEQQRAAGLQNQIAPLNASVASLQQQLAAIPAHRYPQPRNYTDQQYQQLQQQLNAIPAHRYPQARNYTDQQYQQLQQQLGGVVKPEKYESLKTRYNNLLYHTIRANENIPYNGNSSGGLAPYLRTHDETPENSKWKDRYYYEK